MCTHYVTYQNPQKVFHSSMLSSSSNSLYVPNWLVPLRNSTHPLLGRLSNSAPIVRLTILAPCNNSRSTGYSGWHTQCWLAESCCIYDTKLQLMPHRGKIALELVHLSQRHISKVSSLQLTFCCTYWISFEQSLNDNMLVVERSIRSSTRS